MATKIWFLIRVLESVGVRERGKFFSKDGKGEGERGRERERSWRAEGGGFSAAVFVLLAQWQSVNATHRASLLERKGYLCDRKKDGECVCVCERAYMWAIYIFSEMQDLICVPSPGSERRCVCVASLDLQREHTHSQWLIYSRGEALTPGTEPCTE